MRTAQIFIIAALLLALPVATAIPDLTNSGEVDINDLLLVLNNIGRADFNPVADVNEDGVVDLFDLVLVARAFGQQTPPSEWEGSGDPLYPNQPEGWQIIVDNDFRQSSILREDDGWFTLENSTWGGRERRGGVASLHVDDPEEPLSPPSYFRSWYPAGMEGGNSAARVGAGPFTAGQEELYLAYSFRLSHSWDQRPHEERGVKHVFIDVHTNEGTTEGVGFTEFVNTPDFPYYHVNFNVNPVGTASFDRGNLDVVNSEANRVVLGEWALYEVRMRFNSYDAPSGQVHVFLNGVLVAERSDIDIPAQSFAGVSVVGVFGGGILDVPNDQWYDVGHVRVLTPAE